MLKEERFRFILEKLQTHQKVLSADLSAELQVSEDTVRRDLNELAQTGRVHKVHGGALPPSPVLLSYQERKAYALQNKVEIASKAIKLIRSGQVIVLDGGTTTLQIAYMLPQELQLTIYTNSVPIALQLTEHPGVEVVLAGGKLLKHSQVTLGSEAIDTFRAIRADLCFLGVCSIHYEIGLSVPNREEAQVKKAMVASGAQVVALATAEKMGTAETYIVAQLHELDILITDAEADLDTLQLFKNKGIEIW